MKLKIGKSADRQTVANHGTREIPSGTVVKGVEKVGIMCNGGKDTAVRIDLPRINNSIRDMLVQTLAISRRQKHSPDAIK